MTDRPRSWLSDNLPAGAKVARLTIPWRPTFESTPRNRNAVVHVPVWEVGEPNYPFSLCRMMSLTSAAPEPGLPLCAMCVRNLTRRGVWPL